MTKNNHQIRIKLLFIIFIVWGILALTGSIGSAQTNRKFDVNNYSEIPGVREYSGSLIVRPVQMDSWKAKGLKNRDAVDKMALALKTIESFRVKEHVKELDHYIIDITKGKSEKTQIKELMDTGLYEYAEPDWIVYATTTPNDPQFSSQWHHGQNRMQSEDGWTIHTGNPSVVVAIIDDGIRTTHQDLILNRVWGYNNIQNLWEYQGGNISPLSGHGHMMTGIAAANGNNSVGVSGVGWNIGHRMIRAAYEPMKAKMSKLQNGVMVAANAGDKVISVSYSGVDTSSNLSLANWVRSKGSLLIWAAGNENRNLTLSQRDSDTIIVVGAVDQNDNKASFSNYGSYVDLVAPGVSILTTCSGSDNCYAGSSGTSSATPMVAGLAALIWSNDPSLFPGEVERKLKRSCDDLGASGVDNTFGYGRINSYESLLPYDCETQCNDANEQCVQNVQSCISSCNGDPACLATCGALAYSCQIQYQGCLSGCL